MPPCSQVDEQAHELRQQAFELEQQQHLVVRLQQDSHAKEVDKRATVEAANRAAAAASVQAPTPSLSSAASASGGASPPAESEGEGPACVGKDEGSHASPVGSGKGAGAEQGTPGQHTGKGGESEVGVSGDGSEGVGLQPHSSHHNHGDDAERAEQLAILNRMVKEMKIKLAQVGFYVGLCRGRQKSEG